MDFSFRESVGSLCEDRT